MMHGTRVSVSVTILTGSSLGLQAITLSRRTEPEHDGEKEEIDDSLYIIHGHMPKLSNDHQILIERCFEACDWLSLRWQNLNPEQALVAGDAGDAEGADVLAQQQPPVGGVAEGADVLAQQQQHGLNDA